MNVLFIYSTDNVQSRTKPLITQQQMQFGVSYISSLLKKNNHNPKLVVLSKILGKKNRRTIDEYIEKFCPKLICFTSVSTEYSFIVDIAKYIKHAYADIFLLVGGPHVSLNPDGVLSNDFDALCIGEGENPTLELVSQLERNIPPSGIANLWIKSNSVIEKNSPRPFIDNLDELPFPDRAMWQEWLGDKSSSDFSVLLGRGCPFQCTYCCNHVIKKLATGSYVRQRSADNIFEEIKEIVTDFPVVKEIYLEVETVAINIEWALELCSKLKSFNASLPQPLSFGTNIRITPGKDLSQLFAAFKESNFRFVNIGIESGSERIRREVLKRHYSNQDVIDTVALARKYGLQVVFFNIIGIPGETINDFKETVKLNRICLPDWHLTSIFFPYPSTALHSLCKKNGLLNTPIDERLERRRAALDLPGFSRKQIQKSYVWFSYYVYHGHKSKWKILASVFRAKISSNYYLYYCYRKITRLPLFRGLKKVLKIG
ncbi:MAG: radical SAM protein [Planctomycetes bacterium]|nr:radical SAM protein [Planctomycetota bacterium]